MPRKLGSTLLLALIPFVQSQSIDREVRFLGKKKSKQKGLKGKKKSFDSKSHRKSAKLQSTASPWDNDFGLQSTWEGTPKCFDDADDATELGTLVLDSFWYEIRQTNCQPHNIAAVYDAYFRPDLVVNDQRGNVIAEDLEEYKTLSIGDVSTPGSAAYTCRYRRVSYAPTRPAVTEQGIYDDFVWVGNQITHSVIPIIQEQWYLIEMLGASGSFLYNGAGKGGKSGQGSWFYEYHQQGKGSQKVSPHCHRPQIYGIVIFE